MGRDQHHGALARSFELEAEGGAETPPIAIMPAKKSI